MGTPDMRVRGTADRLQPSKRHESVSAVSDEVAKRGDPTDALLDGAEFLIVFAGGLIVGAVMAGVWYG